MHFAIVEGQRSEPSPGIKGSCPFCGAAMIAKCGNQRLHHWAHQGERVCDSWWERETEWHRTWKNRFLKSWQENVRHDHLGEKHIADVLTPHGLVIEFQHSHIRSDERLAREKYYGNMIWVVDGTRLKRDLPRFVDGMGSLRALDKDLFITPFPEELFSLSWLQSSKPVLFDYQDQADADARTLWCLLPGRAAGNAIILRFSGASFVRWSHNDPQPIKAEAIRGIVENYLLASQRQLAQRYAAPNEFQRWRERGRRRRTARF